MVHQVWWLISNNEKGMGKDDLEQRNEEQYVYSVLFDLSFETNTLLSINTHTHTHTTHTHTHLFFYYSVDFH